MAPLDITEGGGPKEGYSVETGEGRRGGEGGGGTQECRVKTDLLLYHKDISVASRYRM